MIRSPKAKSSAVSSWLPQNTSVLTRTRTRTISRFCLLKTWLRSMTSLQLRELSMLRHTAMVLFLISGTQQTTLLWKVLPRLRSPLLPTALTIARQLPATRLSRQVKLRLRQKLQAVRKRKRRLQQVILLLHSAVIN